MNTKQLWKMAWSRARAESNLRDAVANGSRSREILHGLSLKGVLSRQNWHEFAGLSLLASDALKRRRARNYLVRSLQEYADYGARVANNLEEHWLPEVKLKDNLRYMIGVRAGN